MEAHVFPQKLRNCIQQKIPTPENKGAYFRKLISLSMEFMNNQYFDLPAKQFFSSAVRSLLSEGGNSGVSSVDNNGGTLNETKAIFEQVCEVVLPRSALLPEGSITHQMHSLLSAELFAKDELSESFSNSEASRVSRKKLLKSSHACIVQMFQPCKEQ